MTIERRHYKRYLVSGLVEFMTDDVSSPSKLLDIAKGGVLIDSEVVASPGEELAFRFTLSGYQGVFEASGKVVRNQNDVLAFKFLEEPAGLENLLSWLERREPKELISPPRFREN